MSRCSIAMLAFFLSCSPKVYYKPGYSYSNQFCECPNLVKINYKQESAFWKANPDSSHYAAQKEQLHSLETIWWFLNVPEISVNSYRFTAIPSRGNPKVITIALQDTTTIVRVHSTKENVVSSSNLYYPTTFWGHVDGKMDSLFWNLGIYVESNVGASDGTGYYIEGFKNNRYKSIERTSTTLSEQSDLIRIFETLDLLLAEPINCNLDSLICQE